MSANLQRQSPPPPQQPENAPIVITDDFMLEISAPNTSHPAETEYWRAFLNDHKATQLIADLDSTETPIEESTILAIGWTIYKRARIELHDPRHNKPPLSRPLTTGDWCCADYLIRKYRLHADK